MSISQREPQPTNVTLIAHTMPADLPPERAREYFDAYRVHWRLSPSPVVRDYAAAVLRELIAMDRSRREAESAEARR